MAKSLDNTASSKDVSIVSKDASRMSMKGDDLIDMKLHAAQEILAEVFGITVVEAEEMIRQRSKERMLWPERFQPEE